MTTLWTFSNTDAFGGLTTSIHPTEDATKVALASVIVDNDLESKYNIAELADGTIEDLLIVLEEVLPGTVASIDAHDVTYLLSELEMSAQGVGK